MNNYQRMCGVFAVISLVLIWVYIFTAPDTSVPTATITCH